MNPDEFSDALQAIGWTQRGLAGYLGITDTIVRRWASGRVPIPGNVAAWLATLGDVHARTRLPEGWERGD